MLKAGYIQWKKSAWSSWNGQSCPYAKQKIVANIHYNITHPYNVLILKILVTHGQLSGKSRIIIDKPKLIRQARSSISSSVCWGADMVSKGAKTDFICWDIYIMHWFLMDKLC